MDLMICQAIKLIHQGGWLKGSGTMIYMIK